MPEWGFIKVELNEMQAVIEGLLFAAGDVLALDKIAEVLGLDRKTARSLLNKMIDDYKFSDRGIMLREINGSYQLCTKPEYNEFIKMLFEPRQKQGLSQAAYETLAIIAYNQPITKAKVENIRGVNSDSAITRLIDRNLVKEAGRLDTPGKPILLETTEEFLRVFGFKSVKDLPVLEFEDLQAEMEQVSDELI
jgi:segregation and condensation protein B